MPSSSAKAAASFVLSLVATVGGEVPILAEILAISSRIHSTVESMNSADEILRGILGEDGVW